MNTPITKPTDAIRPKLRADFFRLDDHIFAGYIVDERDLTRRFVVEFMLDGHPIKITRADAYSDQLAIENLGDACYGFAFNISRQAIDQGSIVEAKLANISVTVGHPIFLKEPLDRNRHFTPANGLRWVGGLRFEGWSADDSELIPIVTAIIDGERVADAKATRWANVGSPAEARLARRFDLHLPDRFADGRVKRVQFFRENGEEFPGSPISIVAFQDGLSRTIDQIRELDVELPRAALFDRLHPMAMPFSEYASWLARFPIVTTRTPDAAPVAITLVGPGNPKSTLLSLQNGDCPDWVAAALPEGEEPSAFDAEDLRKFLTGDADKTEFVVFAHSGTRFVPSALCRIISAFNEFPKAVAAYGDFDIESRDGVRWPIALPAFDYERMLEQGYCAHLFALRRDTVLDAVAAGKSDLYRLLMFAFDGTARCQGKIIHIPGSLATIAPPGAGADSKLLAQATAEHLRARKIAADVTPSAHELFQASRVFRAIPRGSITIAIPVRNQLELLQSCLRSIQPAMATGEIDIMIVDNESSDPGMLQFLNDLNDDRATVISVPGAFNFARLNNIAAEKAKGDFFCLLNNDVKAIDDQWLREMLSRMREEDVGAVGALLLWPSGVVQHGGTVLGPYFAAEHAFCDRLHTDSGYADLLCVAHECSAVTAACLLTRRRDYLDVGGMDEINFPINFNDVDYCLRLRAKGKRIIFTPRARLLHLESASRGQDTHRGAHFARELQNLRSRWGECLVADPYYNPILSLDATPFSALSWPPRPLNARISGVPIAADIPPGF
jgi:GT2 family glycosyltransferase